MKNILILLIPMLLGSSLSAQNRMVYDSTFGVNGIAAFSGLAWSNWNVLLVQPDDKILTVGGKDYDFEHSDIQMLRLLPDGALDTSFNHTGRVEIANPYQHYFYVADALLQPDGKIIVSGTGGAGNDFKNTAVFSRYNPDGSLDTLFGNQGWIFYHSDSSYVYGAYISLLPDGKIISACQQNSVSSGAAHYLLRWDANGQPDPTFGINGVVALPLGMISSIVQMEVAADGSIFLLGTTPSNQQYGSVLVKATPEGAISGVYPISHLVPGGFELPLFASLTLQPDGKAIVAGSFTFENSVMLRLNNDGTLDHTFNRDGIFNEDLDYEFIFGFKQTILAPDGKILVSGDVYFSLMGFNPNGSLDYNFNGNGEFNPPAIGAPSHVGNTNRPFGIALQSDGKLLQGVVDEGTFYMRRFVSQTCSE